VEYEPLDPNEAAIKFAVRTAVESFWQTLDRQAKSTTAGDRGNRAGVTGGKQMDGFAALLVRTALSSGIPPGSIHVHSKLELPGFFRPEKRWDFVVVDGGNLLAVAELKSQVGPSFGNNFNNRSEEAIGSGFDLSRAFQKRPNPNGKPPWKGWLMLLEDTTKSRSKVGLKQPHFKADSEFRDTSYSDRYGELCRRLVSDGLYSTSAFLLAPRNRPGEYTEPDQSLGTVPFLRSLATACTL
jgi:hypothetical protein